jgi:hypothetical protein
MRWRWFFEIYAESGCRLTKDDYEYLYRGIYSDFDKISQSFHQQFLEFLNSVEPSDVYLIADDTWTSSDLKFGIADEIMLYDVKSEEILSIFQ